MRKLIMTVLTLALILGSISVASAASGKVKLTDIADNANEEAIQVAYDLNIVEGTPEGAYEPEKAVNRAEFAALITRALAVPDSALNSYTTTTFKDTSGYGWAVKYLAFCQEKGIMKGDGYGNAMPGRTINPNEAVTMVLRAIGYTDNASVLVGQWPANYVSLGQSLNLYDDVSADLEMNKASAAQMIYNVLTAQLVQVDANSTVKMLYDVDNQYSEQTLLTTSLNCYRDPAPSDANNNQTKKIVTYADASSSKINLVPKVGSYGTLYRSKVDKEAVALTEVETVFLSGKFAYATTSDYPNIGDIDTFNAVDGTKYNLSTDAKADVRRVATGGAFNTYTFGTFYNGNDGSDVKNYVTKYHNIFTETDYDNYVNHNSNNPDKEKPASNKPILRIAARVSGVTILELRSVAVWNAGDSLYGDNFLYESGQIDGKKFNGHDFPVDVNNEVDDYGYVLEGVDSLDDIAVDNVIYIYKNTNKKIARIDVGTETQSGTITNINNIDGQITIGGKVLSNAPYGHHTTSDIKINNEGTTLLDVYGKTYGFRLGDASKGNYAVVTGYGSGGTGVVSGEQFKLFDKTGSDVVYDVTKTVVKASLNNPPVGQLVKYTLAGGKLSRVDASGEGLGNQKYDGNYGSVNKAGTILTVNTNTTGGSQNHLIDSGVLVLIYDGDDGDFGGSDYSVGTLNDLLENKFTYRFKYYINPDTERVSALAINAVDAGAQNIFVMVNNITDGSDGAGGEIDVVGGLSFADGVSAAGKNWNYIDSSLRNLYVGTGNSLVPSTDASAQADTGFGTARYPMMVKFRVGEDGVLRAAQRLDADLLYTTVTNPTVSGAALYGDPWYNSGSGGTFSLRYSTNNGATSDYATFEANAVLYKVDGSNWVAMRPTEGNLKSDEGKWLYTFLKTDSDKGYDVIIRTQLK